MNLDKTLTIVIQIFILLISITYFNRTENGFVKTAIGLLGLTLGGLLIGKFTGIPLVGVISYVIVYPASIIVFIFHIIRSKHISQINKSFIGLIILTALTSFISKIFHLPGYGILSLFSVVPLGVIFYLNFKWLDKLREELRMMDLIAIIIIIDLLKFSERYWN
jgi:hypothetical protein